MVSVNNFKYSVVTSIFNNFEIVHEIENPIEGVEYVLVTDNPNIVSKTWTVKIFDKYDKIEYPELNWLYVKFFPFEFCENDYCLYIDGSFTIKSDLSKFISYFINNKCEYALAPELAYTSMNHMIDCWKNSGVYDNADNAKFYLQQNEYEPDEWGILSSAIIFRQNTYFTNKIDSTTWKILKEFNGGWKGFRLNQDGLTASLKEVMYKDKRLQFFSQLIFFSPWFEWNWHGGVDARAYNFHQFGEIKNYLIRNKYTAFNNDVIKPVTYLDIVNDLPLLTVVITCYNKEKTIKRAIDSVKSMSYKNWECIIVNNDSIDESVNIILDNIKNDNRFTLISQTNKNVCNARNTGSFCGNGKYLVQLDGDDEIGYSFCEQSILAMEKDENICIGSGIFLRKFLDNTSSYMCSIAADLNHYDNISRMQTILDVCPFTVTSVVRMNRFKAIGGFKEGVEYTQEDWEMFIRYFDYDIKKSNINFVHDDFSVIMYEQSDSKTKTQNIHWGNLNKEREEIKNILPNIYKKYNM